jgi:hypothetical protein
VLDQLYMVARGLSHLAVGELDLSALDPRQWQAYAGRFPPAVQSAAQQMLAGEASES